MSTHPNATVCLTFDVDAVCVWIGAFNMTSPAAISRGEFGMVGLGRILRLLDKHGIPGTFYIPGHTADTYPDNVRAIAAAGHEIGHHNYLHEAPGGIGTREAEREVMLRGLDALDRVAKVRPTGFRSPSFDMSPHTIDLLLELGFTYDTSLMADDYTPYWARVGDRHDPAGGYRFGTEVPLVEMPVSWELDDWPHFNYVSTPTRISPGLSAASKVEEIWSDELTYLLQEAPGGVLNLTMHPQVIGRGHRMLMLERLVVWMKSHPGVAFSTVNTAASAWKATQTPPPRP